MATMGRAPTVNNNLPPRMRARRKPGGIYYYYDTGGKPRREIPLGNDYVGAVRKWAELEADAPAIAVSLVTIKHVFDRYQLEVLPKKAARTQSDNIKEIAKLLEFFNDPPAPLEAIEPIHVRQYMDWRTHNGEKSTTRANREKALLSHAWNKAREWGITSLPNPCTGVKGFTESGRDNYTEDSVFAAVYKAGCLPLREAMDVSYLTGQRPADVLKMSELHIREGILHIDQGKTGKKLRIAIEGQLRQVVDAMLERKKNVKVHSLSLLCTEAGRPLTPGALRSRFERARAAAAKQTPALAAAIQEFQFRDLRAKAATDKADLTDMREAQRQLGHQSMKMTEHYIRSRKGEMVKPTK